MPIPRPLPAPGRQPHPRRDRPGHPTCPDWLDAEAKTIWRRTSTLMAAMGILTRADAGALARYCQTYARWRRAEEFIQQRGEIYPVKSGNGVVKCFFAFPQVAIAQKLAALLTKLERELSLTPASRDRNGRVRQNFDDPR